MTRGRSSPERAAGRKPCLVVGIGASVGGLEAFKTFFANMPADSGMAFVLVQHLAPDHQSILTELIGRSTAMSVVEAADGVAIAPNQVFVIPPNATLTMVAGHLHVEKPAPPRQNRRPIDTFMFSLAEDQGESAVGVILSGSGSDGAQGLAAVKEHGGVTLAQAQFDETAMSGMPSSAAATGLVDHVLAVEDMPSQLLEYQRYLIETQSRNGPDGIRREAHEYLAEVCALLDESVGHDFSQYKDGTLIRRIQRRMQIRNFDTVGEYVAHLRTEPHEVELLFRDLLIGVTHFFRDPDAFAALETVITSELVKNRDAKDQIRVWVPGCATGEEAYSIAIVLREAAAELAAVPRFVIFGTDINEAAIAIARGARYHKSRLDGLPPACVDRWFTEDGDYYCPVPEIREMCVFSVHSVIRDPPFSKLHLISCRNLLIYMDTAAQDRLVPLFHYALQSGGYLFLGPSENVTRQDELFSVLDKKHRIFRRNDNAASTPPNFTLTETAASGHGEVRRPARTPTNPEAVFDRGARRLMARYAPAFVVIDRQYRILRFSGQTGKYLEPSEGPPSFDLFNLVQSALRPAVRSALRDAARTQQRVMQRDVAIEVDGKSQGVNLIVEPILQASGRADYYVVAFQDFASTGEADGLADDTDNPAARQLENELRATRARLQAAIDEAERANEELSSANEAYLSANEEIQSSNEELEASKEELQSLNEELQTLNSELTRKNETLGEVNSDLHNFLDSSQIAMLFLDGALRIRSFTPATTGIFHLRDSDCGRPITDIASRLGYQALEADIKECLRDLATINREVYVPQSGTSYMMSIRPYRTVTRTIDGAVITFVDVSDRKRGEAIRAQLAAIVESSRDAIIGHTLDGTITNWNAGAEQMFGYTAAEAIGQSISLIVPQAQSDEGPEVLKRISRGERVEHFETTRTAKDGRPIGVSVAISPIRDANGQIIGASRVARDVTDRLDAEKHRGLLMAELNHRVKNTLAAVRSIARLTSLNTVSFDEFRRAFDDRLMALSQAHDLLTEGQWKGASLRHLLAAELSPFDDGDGARFAIAGEKVQLNPKQALALGLAIHELATNALKYGALSIPSGRVEVAWDVAAAPDGPVVQLRWIESGGPAVEPPQARGFGSRLIERGLQSEIDAEVRLDFRSEGVRCVLRFPLNPESESP